MDTETALEIIHEYLDAIGTCAFEYWSDRDRYKALEAFNYIQDKLREE